MDQDRRSGTTHPPLVHPSALLSHRRRPALSHAERLQRLHHPAHPACVWAAAGLQHGRAVQLHPGRAGRLPAGALHPGARIKPSGGIRGGRHLHLLAVPHRPPAGPHAGDQPGVDPVLRAVLAEDGAVRAGSWKLEAGSWRRATLHAPRSTLDLAQWAARRLLSCACCAVRLVLRALLHDSDRRGRGVDAAPVCPAPVCRHGRRPARSLSPPLPGHACLSAPW